MIFEGTLINLIATFVSLLIIFIAYFAWSFTYWQRRNIPTLPGASIPFGHDPNPLTRHDTFGVILQKLYNTAKLNATTRKYCGIYFFGTPSLLVNDVDVIKHILSLDFAHFTDRGVYYNPRDDPLSAHLFALNGARWRHLRAKLTPTFTPKKMRHMLESLVLQCAANMSEALALKLEEPEQNRPEMVATAVVDVKELVGCYGTDVIGCCAFGLECNSFAVPDSPFRRYGKKVFAMRRLEILKNGLLQNFPEIGRFFRMKLFPSDVSAFFFKVVESAVNDRRKHKVQHSDFLQLLIDLMDDGGATTAKEGGANGGLSLNEVAAQCFIFFLAGFEAATTTITFALYELARNERLQEKVRDEIETVLSRHNGSVTYEAIDELKYMQQVIDETLRKYPPVPIIIRACVKDYKLPNTELTIEKGTRIVIPVLGIHKDAELYNEPEKFDPGRFGAGKKVKNRFAYMPFGEGPRICIGLRFGVMQTKIGLLSLLRDYKFTPNSRTSEPLKMSPTSFILASEHVIWLNAKKTK